MSRAVMSTNISPVKTIAQFSLLMAVEIEAAKESGDQASTMI